MADPEHRIPERVLFEHEQRAYDWPTAADITLARWVFWRASGQFPWQDAFNAAPAAELEELMVFDNAVMSWAKVLTKNGSPTEQS